MEVAPRTVVTVQYVLKDDDGDVLDSTEGQEPLAYLHGVGQIVPGLERALAGRQDGDVVQVTLAPGDAYGDHDPELVQSVPRSQFQGVDEIEVGMQFQAAGPDGGQMVTVIALDGDDVTLDGNHPLAGMTLHFDVTIVGVRAATSEELEHGHPHGPGDHHHH